MVGRRYSEATLEGALEPLDADVIHINSKDIDAVENIALDTLLIPTVQASNPGYATPVASLLLEFPSMNPAMVVAESLPKRQRSCSEFTRQSFDLEIDGSELMKLWESLDGVHDADQVEAVKRPKQSSPRPGPRAQRSSPRSKARATTNRFVAETPRPSKTGAPKSVSPKIKIKLEPSPPIVKPQTTTKTKPGKGQTSSLDTPLSNESTKKRSLRRQSSPVAQGSQQVLPGPYPPAIRKLKVASYLEKRKRRVWKKEIKYSCRKQFAETRPRVGGRFIPKSQAGTPLQSTELVKADSHLTDNLLLDVADISFTPVSDPLSGYST